jgi:MSHA biogenesis protein MshQ
VLQEVATTAGTTVTAGGAISAGPHADAASFVRGSATASASYAYPVKLATPATLTLGVPTAAPGGQMTGSTASPHLRSGRLRLFNAFGSEKSALQVPLQAEYWNGSAWTLNNADGCTSVPATALALSNYRDYKGAAQTGWSTTATSSGVLSGGRGSLTLNPLPGNAAGGVELALNLGSGSGADQACTTVRPPPTTTGAALAWLRSQNGSCAATWDRDPSARAAFGLYSPETRKTVHVREIF